MPRPWTETDVFRACRIGHLLNVKSSPLVLYRDGHFVRVTAAGNMDVFSRNLMISVNDRVREGFAQCDLNVVRAFGNAAALPEQDHELVHEGRNRSQLAWQRALQFDARAALMGYIHL